MLKEKNGKFVVRHAMTTYVYIVGMAVVGPLHLVYALQDLRGWMWLVALMGAVCTLAAALGIWVLTWPRTVVDPVRRCIDWGSSTQSFDEVASIHLHRVRDTDSESWHVSLLKTEARAAHRKRAALLEERIAFAKEHPEQGITLEQVKMELVTLENMLKRGIDELGNSDSEAEARKAVKILARMMNVPVVDETAPD